MKRKLLSNIITERELSSSFWYLDVTLMMPAGDTRKKNIDASFFKLQVLKSLKQVFGEFGAACPVDILKFTPSSLRAILRCPTNCYVKLRSSLTLASPGEQIDCSFKVHKCSPCLLSMVANNRTYVHSS